MEPHNVIDIDATNISLHIDDILRAVREADFVSIDTEFTGLGRHKNTNARNIETRYVALREVVNSTSILQLGLSMFRKLDESDCFRVETYSFSVFSQEEFVVSPSSMAFLAENGLDLSQLFAQGLRVRFPSPTPSNGVIPSSNSDVDAPDKKKRKVVSAVSPSNQFGRIMAALRGSGECNGSRPARVVLHNGLLDLMHLHKSFYAPLPPTVRQFVRSSLIIFPEVYDTKYIADYVFRERASFLSYLLEKVLRRGGSIKFDHTRGGDPFPGVGRTTTDEQGQQQQQQRRPQPDSRRSLESSRRLRANADETAALCIRYSRHGYCPRGGGCAGSHSARRIVDEEEKKQAQRGGGGGDGGEDSEDEEGDEEEDSAGGVLEGGGGGR